MDLYNPLYVARPVVEPELFASLRPVTYRGGWAKDGKSLVTDQKSSEFKPPYGGYPGVPGANGSLGVSGGLPRGGGVNEFYAQPQSAGVPAMNLARTGVAGTEDERRRHAAELGDELGKRLGTASVGNAATAAALGDFFQYTIDHPVSLARQKSAMLPIVGKDVEGQKVSIYNQSVQSRHPLLGLKFKNTSGAHLNQGPITVFEGSVYAGDTRVLDVQPNEERLVSYAIDLGTEVDPQVGPGTQKITSVKAVKGIVTTVTKVMEEKKYKVINRSQTDRTLLIEHPNRTNQQFKLVDTDKPMEDTPEVYRFQTPVKAGETKTFTVKEEKDVSSSIQLTNNSDEQIRYFINLAEASPALKQKLTQALSIKGEWDAARRELAQVVADLQRLNTDQDRIRKNLRETPKEAEVYETYLKKLSAQEKEIDLLTTKQKKLMDEEFSSRKKFDDYLAGITD
jgi:hypothetical protein